MQHHSAGRFIGISDEPQRQEKERLAYEAVGRKGECKYCGSEKVIRWGKNHGVQVLKCKECGHAFMDNGRLPRMKTPTSVVAAGLKMYIDGNSHKKVGLNLGSFFHVQRSKVAVWQWLQKYAPLVDGFIGNIRAGISDNWHADETAIKIGGIDHWTWMTMDEDTRYILSSLVTEWGRKDEHAISLFRTAKARSRVRPKAIVTDGLQAYAAGVRRNFYRSSDPNGTVHMNEIHFNGIPANNQMQERLNGTYKDRTRTMRGFKSDGGALNFSLGFAVQYNWLRPHESLGGHTPAWVAGVELPFEDGWGDLMKWAVRWKTLRCLA